PAMQKFFQVYSATPNYANPNDPTHNFIQNLPTLNNSNEYSIRVDHRFRDSDNVFFRYTQQNNYTYTPIGEQGFTAGGSPGRNYGGDYVHTFGPTLILDVRAGYAGRPGVDSSQQNQHSAGTQPLSQAGFANVDKFGGMLVTLGGPWNNGGNSSWGVRGQAPRENPTRSVTPSITWLKGNHNIKGGFWWISAARLQQNTFQTWAFSNNQTSNPANTSNTGLTLASALLALPNSASGQLPSRQGGEVAFSYGTWAAYLQDEWKIRRDLTITYGLRYDYLTQPHTNDGRLWNSLDLPDQLWIIGAKTMPALCSVAAQAPCIPDAFQTDPHFKNVVLAGKTASPPPIKDNWAPRLGIAWQVHPKTVIRTGAGLYWDSLSARSQYVQNDLEAEVWPDSVAFTLPTLNTTANTAARQFQFMSAVQSNIPVSLPAANPWGVGGFSDDPRYKDPYAFQYHLEVEQELTPNTVLSMSYLGSHDGRLPFNGKANAASAASPNNTCAKADTACNNAYKASVDALRAMPWVDINNYSKSIGNSSYNGLLTRLQHRYSNGLSTLFSYTWSHSIDTTSGYFGVENGPGGGSVVQNFYDLRSARGTSAFDITHFFSWANIYELPAGRGKRFFQSGPLSWILGNWRTESILQARSGQPFTLQVSGDIANLQGSSPNGPGTYGRPNEIADPFVAGPVLANPDPKCHLTTNQGGSAPTVVRTATNYYNPCAFAVPVASFGTMGRDALRSPAVFNTDLSLTKGFPIGEEKRLDLNFQFFNIFNVQNWDTPNIVQVNSSGSTINPKAGLINSLAAGTTPREMQFGLHFYF
ncbi:MAG: TonB-dependent receptor, partial [Acidobacteria bacterium]|nr:TonB-dependent receptor [Acidobacteriota bacterium]